MNFEELKAIIDEALVRLGPGWYYEVLRQGDLKLIHPKKKYSIRVSLGYNGMEIYPMVEEAELRRYTYTSGIRFKMPYSTSSAKIANAINLHVFPKMDEAILLAERELAGEQRNSRAVSDFEEKMRAISPHLVSASRWDNSLKIEEPRANRYAGPILPFACTLNPSSTTGRNVVHISGPIPEDIALELLRMLEQRFYPTQPELPMQEAGAVPA